MKETYLTSMQASAVGPWLNLQGSKDGVTWLDVLALPEGTTAAGVVTARAQAQAALLDDIGQRFASAQQPQYAGMAKDLAASVRAAGADLADPTRFQDFLGRLLEARRGLFERTVAPTITPGKRLSEQETASCLALAQGYRLPAGEAKRVLLRLSGFEGTEGKYASFGIVTASGDPAGTTHFDLLGLDETTADPRLIRAQMEAQTRRAKEAEQKFPQMELKRNAREFAEAVRQAGQVLLSTPQREAYLHGIRKLRGEKLREEIRLAHRPGDRVKPELVVRLMAAGKRMRLRDLDIRQIITEVTGFADYLGLLGERTHPVLGHLEGLRFDISTGKAQPGTADDRKPLLIRNDGAAVLEGILTPNCEWIRCQPVSFSTDSVQEIEVKIDSAGLPRGVPVAGQIQVESTGGSQIVAVEAIVGAGDQPADVKERIAGALIGLVGFWFFPLAMFAVFYFEKRSRFLTRQAACVSILGVLFAGCSVVRGFLGACFIGGPLTIAIYVLFAVVAGLAILSLLGKSFRVPILSDLADRFA